MREAAGPLLLMALSGVAALGWQWVWTAQLSGALGHEAVAVLATVASFFAGLALGSMVLGRAIERSRVPQRWYVICEIVIALWGTGLCLLGPLWVSLSGALIGAEPSAFWHWTVAFALPAVLFLPATAAMGATLPALERAVRGRQIGGDRKVGGLYAANTLGAVAGVLLAVFWALPQWGVVRTGLACAALNLLCAGWGWMLWRSVSRASLQPDDRAHSAAGANSATSTLQPVRVSNQRASDDASSAGAVRAQNVRIGCLLGASGLLGIGYEVLAVRVLSQVTENTIYSHALLLAVYLLGTAAGAACYQRWRHTQSAERALLRDDDERLTARLLGALALAVLAGGASLWWAQDLCQWPAQRWGATAWTALAGEALAGVAALGLPTVMMGVVFTHLCLRAQSAAWSLGRALAVNTAGAALAPALLGVLVLPTWGAGVGLALLVIGYTGMQAVQRWQRVGTWGPALLALALLQWSPPLRFIDQPAGAQLVSYRDGVMAAVSVVQDDQGVARLRINNRAQEGSSASGWLERRLALLPLLLRGQGLNDVADRPTKVPGSDPALRALFLGLGTGFTAAAAAESRLHVEAVELLPEVVEAADYFGRFPGAPQAVIPVRHITADARRFVQAGESQYDLIVADLFHPARDGAGSLYTVEQFHAVRARLAPGGLFCQWLALHQMELDTLRSIVAAFVQAYPEGYAILLSNSLDTPVLGLVARPGTPSLNAGAALARASDEGRRLARLDDPFAVLGSVLAGPAELRRFVEGVAPNTDDRPRVVLGAPWDTYAPQTTPRERLQALLQALQPRPAELLADADSTSAARLHAYWGARQRYIEIGLSVQTDSDLSVTLSRVQAPLLAVLDQSPDFTPAREALTAMASALAPRDPDRARGLFQELQLRESSARQLRVTTTVRDTPGQLPSTSAGPERPRP